MNTCTKYLFCIVSTTLLTSTEIHSKATFHEGTCKILQMFISIQDRKPRYSKLQYLLLLNFYFQNQSDLCSSSRELKFLHSNQLHYLPLVWHSHAQLIKAGNKIQRFFSILFMLFMVKVPRTQILSLKSCFHI